MKKCNVTKLLYETTNHDRTEVLSQSTYDDCGSKRNHEGFLMSSEQTCCCWTGKSEH